MVVRKKGLERVSRREDLESIKNSAEIRDPIHGYIFASDFERRIIDTETFQRLRRIRQLAGCFLVYPGGQHSRFEHVIGAMFLAGKVGNILQSRTYLDFTADDTRGLRAAALLHDVGHGPFSHLFEEVVAEKTPFNHEAMTEEIIRSSEIGDVIDNFGFSKKELSDLAVGKSAAKKRYMNDIIGGGLSVDLMDYLPRDSYFTGVEYGSVDINRIMNSLEVVGGKLALSEAARFAFEALIIARYEMFRAVYFHRAVRSAELMLIRAMLLADKELHLTDLSLDNYLSLTDEVTLGRLRSMNPRGDRELKKAKVLADGYYARDLLKCVYEQPVQRKKKTFDSNDEQRKFRDSVAEEIASLGGVDVDEIFVDVPTAPSVPLSSAKEALEGIMLVKSGHGESFPRYDLDGAYELRIRELPLVNAISGYLDVIRVYTSGRDEKIRRSAGRVLGHEKISQYAM